MATIILAEPLHIMISDITASIDTGTDILESAKEGTVTIAESDVTKEEKKNERGDVRYTFASKDPISIELELDDFGSETQLAVLNRVPKLVTIDGNEVTAFAYNNSTEAIFKKMKFVFKSADASYFYFPKLQLYSSLNLASIASETGSTKITMSAYPDDDGNVAYQVIPTPPPAPASFANKAPIVNK